MSWLSNRRPGRRRSNTISAGDYRVLATWGHVRDLPAKDGSVRPDSGFAMTYASGPRARRVLGRIRTALKDADSLILATDPDREGEAIAWQVLTWLQERDAMGERPVRRVAFHEITPEAVRAAMAEPREIDMDLVHAQQARRALDYLVGFHLSPVLWRKLPGSRSAGRVQSVALRLICEREAEIEAFFPRQYWTVEARGLVRFPRAGTALPRRRARDCGARQPALGRHPAPSLRARYQPHLHRPGRALRLRHHPYPGQPRGTNGQTTRAFRPVQSSRWTSRVGRAPGRCPPGVRRRLRYRATGADGKSATLTGRWRRRRGKDPM